MAKEGQTTSRLGSQPVFNNVREVVEASNCDPEEGGRLSKRPRPGWSVVERRTTKAGGSEEAT